VSPSLTRICAEQAIGCQARKAACRGGRRCSHSAEAAAFVVAAPVGAPKPDLVEKVRRGLSPCPRSSPPAALPQAQCCSGAPVHACGRLSDARARQFLGEELLSGKDRLRVEMRNAAAPFERFEGDTGSSEVQGAHSHPQLFFQLQHRSCLVRVGGRAPHTPGSFPVGCSVAASD